MRCAIVALLLLAAAPVALACRGPFSAAYQIRLRAEHQVYLGKVISVEERPFASGTRQWREHVTTLQVLRAWIKNPPTTITVRGLQMSIGYDEHCVKSALPKDGEEWLVVAHPDPNGVLQAEQLMSLNMETTNGEAGVAVIKKTLGNGYDPKVQANKPLEPTR